MNEPRDWIDFAREDLEMAELAFERGIYNQACFHAQQGIEKALKAFLKTQQAAVPKIHGLGELLSQCRNYDGDFSELEETCAKLDFYYMPTRYPDVLPGAGPSGLPTRQEAEEAVSLLRSGLQWIEKKLSQ